MGSHGVLQLVLKETFTDGGSTMSHAPSDMAHADKQDTAASPPTAPNSAQPACESHGGHIGAAEPAVEPEEATAMEGVEGSAAVPASDAEERSQQDKHEKVQQHFVMLRMQWRRSMQNAALLRTYSLAIWCTMTRVT